MFNCLRDCTDHTGAWNATKRAARACPLSRFDMPRVEPAPQASALYEPVSNGSPYHGRHADRRLDGKVYLNVVPVSWKQPIEDPDDGCPGGAYRSEWVDSLARYIRHRTADGTRVSNRFFDECDDRLVWEAVHYYESEQERHADYVDQLRSERLEAKRSKSQPAPEPAGRRRNVTGGRRR